MRRGALFALLLGLALACSRPTPATKDPAASVTPSAPAVAVASVSATTPPLPPPALEARLRARATTVLAALKAKDMKALAALVHPTQGVRFSAYAYIDTATDVALTPTELSRAMTDARLRVWGTHDGKGDPIKETFAGYYAAFVWTHDFTLATEVAVDREIGGGNTLSNVAQAYPKGHFVEAHFPGFDKKYGGMDWESLRLVFEDATLGGGTELMLVGIVHAQWTI